MVGITLLPEQIHRAPPEVRQWLEQEVIGALGVSPAWPAPVEAPPHLVQCSIEEARAILKRIQGVLPAVSVFFELGREPVTVSLGGVHTIGITALMRQARLQSPSQLADCLAAINAALQAVRGEPGAALAGLGERGYCLVADVTSRSILTLWHEIVAAQAASGPEQTPLRAKLPPGNPYPAPLPSGTSA